MQKTLFHGQLSGQALTGLEARPSLVAGPAYDQVSKAYYQAVHLALTRKVSPAEALTGLQTELGNILKNQRR